MRMRVYRGCLKKGVLKRLKAANCQKAVFLRSPVGRGEPNRCGGGEDLVLDRINKIIRIAEGEVGQR